MPLNTRALLLYLVLYWNEVGKGESQMWYRWCGDDVVAVGLVVAADCQHRSMAGNRDNEPRAKCKSTNSSPE